MSNKIVNGDYVRNAEGLENVEYIEELLQNVKIILTASRGGFYPDKNFGSRIREVSGELNIEYALIYARQALDTLDGVCVKQAVADSNGFCFTLDINGEERQVTVDFENDI